MKKLKHLLLLCLFGIISIGASGVESTVILPTAENGSWEGKYWYSPSQVDGEWENGPQEDWYKPDFDDSNWKTIKGSISNDSGICPEYTRWEGEYDCYWVRRTFTLSSIEEDFTYILKVIHDDDCKVYLNGNEIYNKDSCVDRYAKIPIDKNLLIQGNNTLAIWVSNIGGARAYLDCGITKAIGIDGFVYEFSGNSAKAVECLGCNEDVTIPETITCGGQIYTVTALGANLFEGQSLNSLIIPKTVEIIEDHIVYYNHLNELIFAEGSQLKSIGDWAFCGSGLTHLTLPSTLKTIGHTAFGDCPLEEIFIPKSLINIGENAFDSRNAKGIIVDDENQYYNDGNGSNAIIETSTNTLLKGCSNTTIPNTVSKINQSAFYGVQGLKSISLPTSVKEIGIDAFKDCPELSNVDLGQATAIGDGAFFNCPKIKSLYIPKTVTKIGYRSFNYGEGLEEICVDADNDVYDSRDNCNAIIQKEGDKLLQGCVNTIIPNGVKTIEECAFANNKLLKHITIPASVTRIGYCAFQNCSGLSAIFVNHENPISIPGDVFSSRIPSLIVPVGTKEKYMNALVWKDFFEIVEYGEDYTEGTTLFSCVNNEGKTIYYQVTSETDLTCNVTFDNQYENKYVGDYIIPETVKYKSKILTVKSTSGVFEEWKACKNLHSVVLPNTIEYIDWWSFTDSGLKSITIPSSVKNFGGYPFLGCPIENVFITDLDKLAECGYCYEDASPLGGEAKLILNGELVTDATFSNASTISGGAFRGYSYLTSVNMSESVKSIGVRAFAGCPNLKSVVIPKSVATIGDAAFVDCNNLSNIIVKRSKPIKITKNTFSNWNAKLIVPAGTKSLYSTSAGWKNFKNIIEDEPTTPFYAKYVEANFGKQVVLPIYLNNDESVCGFQFDIELPEGFSIATSGRKATYVISAGAERFAGLDHTVTSQLQSDGSVRVLCSSITNANINDDCKDAPVINITINVDASVVPADYMVKLKNITLARFVDAPIEVNLPDAYSTITVLNAFPVTATSSNNAWGTTEITGDNYDSETGNAVIGTNVTLTATPADGFAFVNWTENGEEVSAENPLTFTVNEGRNLVAVFTMLGDVYENNVVNVTDLSATVGIILNRTTPTRREYVAANIDNDDKIDVADYSNIAAIILNGGVSAAKSDDFTKYVINMQYDMHIPVGLNMNADDIAAALRQTALAKNHSIVTRELENGDIRVLVLSMQNEEIANAKAMLEEIAIPATEATGEYSITLSNIILAYNDLSKEEVSMMNQKLLLVAPTGITSYENDNDNDNDNDNIYNLNGQKLQKATNGINIIDGKKYIIK